LPCESITPFGRPAGWAEFLGRIRRAGIVGLQHHDRRQGRCFSALADPFGKSRILDDQKPRFRVLRAPRSVVGIVVDVKRDDDQAEAERGEIGGDPGDAVPRAQCDAVAASQPFATERRLPARDLARNLADGNVAPRLVDIVAIQNVLRVSEMLGEVPRDVCRHCSSPRRERPISDVPRASSLPSLPTSRPSP